jgi:hypothetical protein
MIRTAAILDDLPIRLTHFVRAPVRMEPNAETVHLSLDLQVRPANRNRPLT